VVVAGLTGSIASGKSTVSGFFKKLGARVIDADKIARDCVRKKTPCWEQIIDHFGKDILLTNQELDREKLGRIIFRNSDEKKMLNSIVHPCVHDEIESQIKTCMTDTKTGLIVLDIPLIYETGMYHDIYPVIVVYVPENIQLQRLMERDGLSQDEAIMKIRSQISIEEKKEMTELIIDNSGSLEHTENETISVFRKLTGLK